MPAKHELECADVAPDAATRQTSLPPSLTSFVGRKPQIAELLTLLNSTSLLTLVGSGGIGKTRLALEVARRAGPSFPRGGALVELAALSDDRLVPQALAAVLRTPEQSGRTFTETLVGALTAQQCSVAGHQSRTARD